MSTKKADRKKRLAQTVALVIAGIMIFSVVAAAVLSQVW